MSGLVSSFEKVKIGEFRYLFIIVTWNDYASGIAEDLFKFLKSQTKKENFKKWLAYIEISPGIFGFNIDGNKIFEELL